MTHATSSCHHTSRPDAQAPLTQPEDTPRSVDHGARLLDRLRSRSDDAKAETPRPACRGGEEAVESRPLPDASYGCGPAAPAAPAAPAVPATSCGAPQADAPAPSDASTGTSAELQAAIDHLVSAAQSGDAAEISKAIDELLSVCSAQQEAPAEAPPAADADASADTGACGVPGDAAQTSAETAPTDTLEAATQPEELDPVLQEGLGRLGLALQSGDAQAISLAMSDLLTESGVIAPAGDMGYDAYALPEELPAY